MRAGLLPILRCLKCHSSEFQTRIQSEFYEEWREGFIICHSCGFKYPLDHGISNFLVDPNAEIKKEIEGAESEIRIHDKSGESFKVTQESIERFSHLFESMPFGDDSYFFKEGGSFQNFAEGAHRFYDQAERWNFKPGLKVLEIGAGFCWASREIAKKGCDLVSIDICKYLYIADIYLKKGLFFERMYADMNELPFKDESFDVLFAAATIHHSSNLSETFKEFSRVIKKGGRIILLNECFVGILEKAQVHGEDFAYNDHYYPVAQWNQGLKNSGFKNIKISYLSIFKDYVERKKARGAKNTFKTKLAGAISSKPALDKFISFPMIPFRLAFRPKSVLIEAER